MFKVFVSYTDCIEEQYSFIIFGENRTIPFFSECSVKLGVVCFSTWMFKVFVSYAVRIEEQYSFIIVVIIGLFLSFQSV